MAKHGKRYLEAREKIDREKLYTPAEAVRLIKGAGATKFDQSVEVHVRTGPQRPPCRRAAPRHARPAPRARQERHDRRLRQGRQGEGGRGGRRRLRRGRGPRDARAGRLHRFRRRDRDARHDARGRPARPHPRPAGQDAEPEGRHGHDGRAQGRRGVQGRQGRVPHRPDRDRPHGRRQDLLRGRALLGNYQAIIEELIRAKPSSAKGRYIRSIVLASSMGPGIKVDPRRRRT